MSSASDDAAPAAAAAVAAPAAAAVDANETRVFLIDTVQAAQELATVQQIVPFYHPGEPNMMLVGPCQAIGDIAHLFGGERVAQYIRLRDLHIAMLRHDADDGGSEAMLFGVAARTAFTSERCLDQLCHELYDTALFFAGSLRNLHSGDLLAIVREFDANALREFGPEAASARLVRHVPNRLFVDAAQLLRQLMHSERAAFLGAAVVTAKGGVLAEFDLDATLTRRIRARVMATAGSASALPLMQFVRVWPLPRGAASLGLFVQSFVHVSLAVLMPLALLNDQSLMRSTSIVTADALHAIDKRLAKLADADSRLLPISAALDSSSTAATAAAGAADAAPAEPAAPPPAAPPLPSTPTMASQSEASIFSAAGAAGGVPLDGERQRASARSVIELNRLSHALAYNRPSTQFLLNATANHALFESDEQVSAIVERKYYAAIYSKREFGTDTHFQSNIGFNLNHETFLSRIDDVFESARSNSRSKQDEL